ncbi:MAG: hypothetical protein LBP54_02545 [Campylobacteraceae bacterium]|jgi:hypothetical protein|nr:hypothetical protein [Campylobacteraceae bacterium]
MKKIVLFTVFVGLTLGFTGCESKESKKQRCLKELSTNWAASEDCKEILLEVENEERKKLGLTPRSSN